MKTKVIIHPKKGRAVIATEEISAGEVIFTNYATPITFSLIEKSELAPWSFWWNDIYDAIVFGEISFINHSSNPNTYLERNFDNNTMVCIAKRDIKIGEELSYLYACELWFEPVED